ncbi:odorant receptor 4-like [Leptidea sinapis]|uniref:odorant receptor 4-like n=1 Tax=Leptidea sinapis TaxID=189913 RepID=UPI0021C2D907|nr:odorant receptor 4-like [Leptidea sinapis]
MNYQQTFDDPLKLTKLALLLSGINVIDKNISKAARLAIDSLFFFNLAWLYMDVIAEFFWLLDGLRIGKSFDELSIIAPCTTICLLSSAKSTALYCKGNILKATVKKFKEINEDIVELANLDDDNKDTNESVGTKTKDYVNRVKDRDIIKKSVKTLHNVILIMKCSSVVVVLVFCSLPLLSMAYDVYNYGETVKKLPFLVKYFFNPFTEMMWPLVYFHQIWSTIISCFNVFGPDTLFYSFCMYISINFDILSRRFTDVVAADDDETRKRLRACVLRHQELIELVNKVEVMYSPSTLCNIIISSFLICLSAFNITFINDIGAVFAFFTFLLMSFSQISLLCYFGDMIMTSSVQIYHAVYNCQWYSTSSDIKRSIYIILIRSQKPCKLTAANFATLNLNAFTTILSRSWSYFALLRTMYN